MEQKIPVYRTLQDIEAFKALEDPQSLLGGKATGVFRMITMGLPVPPAFTFTTDLCMGYLGQTSYHHKLSLEKLILDHALAGMADLTKEFGYTPLVSVRSGARVSMPGMMDTILNVGLTTDNIQFWQDKLGARAALDSYRRLIQMYGSVVMDIDMDYFNTLLRDVKEEAGVVEDKDLSDHDLNELLCKYHELYKDETGQDFPDTIEDQLKGAILAVFRSWGNDRAKIYRKLNGYPEDWGTSATVQAMVFGNLNDQSCSGVLFSRDPSSGDAKLVGEFLPNAQGEDVVAGIRTPLPLTEMQTWGINPYMELLQAVATLEDAAKDMQDVEFTVQDGKLYILQTRNGKRSARAAFKIAWDLHTEGLIDKAEMFRRVKPKQYLVLTQPAIDPAFTNEPDFVGIAGGGGIVSGVAVFSSKDAVDCKEPCILVAHETTPDDIAGMNASVGILTATGGLTSHAAVVARGMDKTCVVGCTDLTLKGKIGYYKDGPDKMQFVTGCKITIDGATGNVWIDKDVPIVTGAIPAEAASLVGELISQHDPLLRDDSAVTKSMYVDTANYEGQACEGIAHDIEEFIERCLETQNDPKVVVDLTPSRALLSSCDLEVLDMFGNLDTGLDTLKAKVLQLAQLKLHSMYIKVIMPPGVTHYVKSLMDYGFTIISEVSSIKDLLKAKDYVKINAGAIEKLFEDTETYQEFLSILKSSGKDIKAVPAPLGIMEFLAEKLG